MGKILAVDTSSFVMGVAVIDGEKTLGEVITNIKKNHSIRLMPAIQQMMAEVDVTPDQLERIVVAAGPGSYTGVRIGVTIAKSLAWSLKIPVVGVSSLQVMAQNGYYYPHYVCPLIDARRGQVYTGLYKQGGMIQEDRLILLEDWLEQLQNLDEPILFVGQDVEMHRESIINKLKTNAEFALFSEELPRPSELARIGRILEAESSAHMLVPNYHQLAEAEAKWQQAQKEIKK